MSAKERIATYGGSYVSIVIRPWVVWLRLYLWQGRDLFSLYYCIQTGYGAHPVFCTVGAAGCFCGGKAPGGKVDCSPPYSAEVK